MRHTLYVFSNDNRLLFYVMRPKVEDLLRAGTPVTVFKKKSAGDPGFKEHPGLKIVALPTLLFKYCIALQVLFARDKFSEIYSDDKKLAGFLRRFNRKTALIEETPSPDFKTLDVGCGGAKTPGAIGIDMQAHEDIDIIADLNKYPWPFKRDTFDFLYCISVIEHLDNVVKTMEELHRIGKNGSVIIIDTSHFAHPNSYRDPTHKWHFTLGTFDYFTGEVAYPRYSKCRFKMLKKELHFRKKYCTGKLYAFFSARRYEKYYCHKCPPHSIYFEIEIVKD